MAGFSLLGAGLALGANSADRPWWASGSSEVEQITDRAKADGTGLVGLLTSMTERFRDRAAQPPLRSSSEAPLFDPESATPRTTDEPHAVQARQRNEFHRIEEKLIELRGKPAARAVWKLDQIPPDIRQRLVENFRAAKGRDPVLVQPTRRAPQSDHTHAEDLKKVINHYNVGLAMGLFDGQLPPR